MEIRKIILRAAFCPFEDGNYAYAGAKYKDVKRISWRYLKGFHDKLCNHLGYEASKLRNESDLVVRIPTSKGYTSEIYLVGLDNTNEPLRGSYLDGIVLDEWSLYRQNILGQVRPTLSDISRQGIDELGYTNQWADFIFTPQGRNHAYHAHKAAEAWFRGKKIKQMNPLTGLEEDVKRDDWYAVLYRASQTGYVTENELSASLSDMGEDLYLQEFECSFDATVKGAIFARALNRIKENGQIGHIPYNPMRSVNTAWDLGINDSTVIWFFQTSEENNTVKLIDYYENNNQALDYYIDIMKERNYTYGYHLLPHDVANRELGSGKSRYDILTSLGMRNIRVVPKMKEKADGLHSANAFISRCYFDAEKCEVGIDNLSLYRREWNEKLNVLQDNPVKDSSSHTADAFQILSMGIKQFREKRREDFIDDEMYL